MEVPQTRQDVFCGAHRSCSSPAVRWRCRRSSPKREAWNGPCSRASLPNLAGCR